MAEGIRGKSYDLSCDNSPSDYSLLSVPVKETVGLYWTIDDENLESRLFNYGCMVGQSVGSSKYLKKHFPNSQVLGIDISTTAIRAAAQLVEPSLSFEVKNVENTNLPVSEFDLITAFQTHFHWSDLTQAFLELKRILKPDGIILLACEWSKLAYFLPNFRKQENLEQSLSNLDLHLIDSQRKGQWILYKIGKK